MKTKINFDKVFKDKTVLITGHTGFKGSWLSAWLNHLGAKVVGVSLDIPTSPSNFSVSSISNVLDDQRIDITDSQAIKNLIEQIQPNFVFHLAAQALVRLSYENPAQTMFTNAIGSVNILDAIKTLKKKVVVVMITSDKAYDNVEWVWGYRETDKLGGKDPYSASKGMAELAIRSYTESFFNNSESKVRLGIARAGNVIGGGDWASDRIVPDCMNSWSQGRTVNIRSPYATRPWQHVLEPLSGYLSLARKLSIESNYHGQAYNFGPSSDQNFSVGDLIDEMSRHWEQVNWKDTSDKLVDFHEAGLLKLNCDKALIDLDWQSALTFKDNVKMTVEWYKYFYQNPKHSMYDFTVSQIDNYVNIAKSKSLIWAQDD
jgi:CDP-glucose 4,6-dehydratase